MKELKLKLSDEVFKNLENEMGLKSLCGEVFGMPDEMIIKIIKAIRNDHKSLTLTQRKKR